MSFSLALSSAVSGLSLSARGTQVVSDNIANAATPGYASRQMQQAARVTGHVGSGVAFTGITRDVDPALLREARSATTRLSGSSLLSEFWKALETEIGVPGDAGALGAVIDRFDAALLEAQASPEAPARLANLLMAAQDITTRMGDIETRIQDARQSADAGIARDVGTLNAGLARTAELNDDIQRLVLRGSDPSALFDQRQRLVDDLSAIIPFQEIPKENGRVMLLGAGGEILVDRKASQFAFSAAPAIAPGDRVEDGQLSGLTLDGRAVNPAGALLSTGQLGAAFELRDTHAPGIQNKLDALAQDIVARFADPATDPTLPPGAPGLFDIAPTALPYPDPVGFAGRLRLNPAADPAQGGETWRLRSGMGAATPGPPGEIAVLQGMTNALNAVTQIGAFTGTLSAHSATLLADAAQQRVASENHTAFLNGRAAGLAEDMAARGVDTDDQLRNLLVLEQAYAANARVISAVDAMTRTLLEI